MEVSLQVCCIFFIFHKEKQMPYFLNSSQS